MRRKDREVTNRQQILSIMESCDVCRLGLVDNNMPYVVPMCFAHQVNEDEVYIRFVDGICQAEIYSDTVQYYLADRMGNRYCAGI
ncbi:MAG: pyridoxamine 5'-phosphate oxidase family protein, partial [Peptococcaceae bacterium]|nr:pyridoxamine 5'-phosphate oxidase family protein [Peptococcaceae bacterium]